ncbi:hypothetical protein F2Q69_00061534 [Brassica cretica]|uniref:Uncharacterized protein n=1 Tax=Brassica cretica TaxID=69181 RepID=A0A8S9RBW4_BRACR|nr:hypothetical protein F2Q69_00061534 [Brassica cretica]
MKTISIANHPTATLCCCRWFKNALITARIIQLLPQVVARVLAAVPASPREELWESSSALEFYCGFKLFVSNDLTLIWKAKVTPLTPAQQRCLVSNHLCLPSSDLVKLIPDVVV